MKAIKRNNVIKDNVAADAEKICKQCGHTGHSPIACPNLVESDLMPFSQIITSSQAQTRFCKRCFRSGHTQATCKNEAVDTTNIIAEAVNTI